MISECSSLKDAPTVPVEPWRPNLSVRASDLAMMVIARAGGVLARVCGDRSHGRFGILTYHRTAPLSPGIPAPPYNVTPDQFREQIAGLLKRGFKFISLRQAIGQHEIGGTLPATSVVVTFDDCFESVYTHAWPILAELQVPATLLLGTAYLDSNEPFPYDTWAKEFQNQVPADHYLPIRTDQCREMADSGLIEMGTHTHTHADFRRHVEAFGDEMQVAAEIVRLRFGSENPCFSLPFGNPHTGYASAELLSAARRSGAACALTTETALVDVADDPFGWGRFNVFPWDTSATLMGKLYGWYDWAPRLKHRLQRGLKGGAPQ